MNLEKVTKINQIKKGDTLIITGDTLKNEQIKAQIVKVSADGTEIIFNKRQNKFFNLGMFLSGNSWVKELSIVK
ncbi:MAG: hypothetical protein HRT69_17980 [Flavobacteriaceae bacterium]|nr:hypothetical protein [Flavobacteriaceae bacterium]